MNHKTIITSYPLKISAFSYRQLYSNMFILSSGYDLDKSLFYNVKNSNRIFETNNLYFDFDDVFSESCTHYTKLELYVGNKCIFDVNKRLILYISTINDYYTIIAKKDF